MNRVIAVSACLLAITVAGCGEKRAGTGAKEAAPVVVTGVGTVVLQTANIPDRLEAVGSVKALNSAVVAARIPGVITSLTAKEGERVAKGKLLMTLEAQESTAAAARASAGVDEAKRGLDETMARKKLADSTFERFAKLLAEQAVTRQEFDIRQTEKELAAQNVARAEARLAQARETARAATAVADYTRITAPISGIITSKSVDLGATVFPAMPLMTIEEEGNYRLEVAVPESHKRNLAVGQSVAIAIDGIDASGSGKVVEIVPMVDPASRTFIAKISLATKGVRSGMYGRAFIPVGMARGITVPKSALSERGSLTSIWVVDKQNIAHMRLVKAGKTMGEQVEIISGLSDGERVVSGDLTKVSEGARIE